MKIAILGSRGIPNNYGGFEQFAEYLSLGLIELGHEVTVYNSSRHPYKSSNWKNINIIHKSDPERFIGTAGQFIYDLNCILDSRKRSYDLILQLGYTSSSSWGKLLPSKSIIVTNMDGMEWKRSKYSKPVQTFLKKAERWAIKTSDYLISDSVGVQDYLIKEYGVDSEFIPYGANIFENPDFSIVRNHFSYLTEYNYEMLIARIEPENNIDCILEGKRSSKGESPFVVIGNHASRYGEYLKKKYNHDERIKFIGGIYNMELLNNLRHYSRIYFHGHSVGGTNPSLLEAMSSHSLICAHENIFNKSILGVDAFYFGNAAEVRRVLDTIERKDYLYKVENNSKKIKELYSWELIISKYENFFRSCLDTQDNTFKKIKKQKVL